LIRVDCALSAEPGFHEGLFGQHGAGGTWVQEAKGGTLLLEHLECLPPPMQKELVSVLRSSSHGFRLICTSNEDLEKITDEGHFNDELFYRVASLPVALPPLRERTEDLPDLVKHFISRTTNPLFDANLVEFTEDAMVVFRAYHWRATSPNWSRWCPDRLHHRDPGHHVATAADAPARAAALAALARISRRPGATVHRRGLACLSGRQGQGGQGARRRRSPDRLTGAGEAEPAAKTFPACPCLAAPTTLAGAHVHA